MGQAKARGSFEARQALAIEKAEQERKEREEKDLVEQLERRQREIARRNSPERVYSPLGRSAHNRAVLLTSALAAMAAASSMPR